LITNGSGFSAKAAALKNAGLDRVTFSLDSLDRENFRSITGVDRLDDVVAAIHAARDAGFVNTKINAVIIRGRNDHEIVGLARFARREGLAMRFIEFMPLDAGQMWDRGLVVSGAEIRDRVDAVFPLVLEQPSRGKETAWRYRFTDGANGEIGIIAPVTDAFCGACSRVRLTADGQLRTCLFSTRENDLRALLRNGGNDADLVDLIRLAVLNKEQGHSINSGGFVYAASRSMSAIGG
jgi:cyclic pyranopterin phosphate synthase